jgi:hypothetical protein
MADAVLISRHFCRPCDRSFAESSLMGKAVGTFLLRERKRQTAAAAAAAAAAVAAAAAAAADPRAAPERELVVSFVGAGGGVQHTLLTLHRGASATALLGAPLGAAAAAGAATAAAAAATAATAATTVAGVAADAEEGGGWFAGTFGPCRTLLSLLLALDSVLPGGLRLAADVLHSEATAAHIVAELAPPPPAPADSAASSGSGGGEGGEGGDGGSSSSSSSSSSMSGGVAADPLQLHAAAFDSSDGTESAGAGDSVGVRSGDSEASVADALLAERAGLCAQLAALGSVAEARAAAVARQLEVAEGWEATILRQRALMDAMRTLARVEEGRRREVVATEIDDEQQQSQQSQQQQQQQQQQQSQKPRPPTRSVES